ncbi:hypothetical protein B0T10DRAFT_101833 [Thelonectria olida]|uniref:Uncharacterized protein n=1 Tax=Thelonectria olida TaxID=1576542 RepID=A0A9P9AUU4_9HYPO|nr:hypothetical protein B0T10DRAFT_101833 [Thelonectria olida]
MQRVARVVAAENVALKGLLATKGVASDEVEAHLHTSGVTKSPMQSQVQTLPQMAPQANVAMPPLSVWEDLAGTRESRLEPIREMQMQYDPRLDTPYKMPSPAPSASSSIITSTPSAPASISVPISTPLPALTPVSCGPSPTHMAMPPQTMQPRPCSPVIPIPRLSSSMAPDRSLPPLQQQSDLSPKRQGSSAGGLINGLRLPMVLDKPPSSMVQSQLDHGCYAQSNLKPKLGCRPKPQAEHYRCHSHTLPRPHMMGHHRHDQTHCVEAASILARLRGNSDDSLTLAGLGCSDNKDFMVRNTDLLQLMD